MNPFFLLLAIGFYSQIFPPDGKVHIAFIGVGLGYYCDVSCATPLSEMSILEGGSPQAFPDFTRGKWIDRKPVEIE